MLIAQLTDLHVGPRGRLLHGIVDTEALLARAVDALLVFRPRPAIDPYSTGIPGVYLCSAGTPPGAGAHGMCGFNAALSALSHL